VPAEAVQDIRALFQREQIILPKKTKSGVQDQNIIPMICNVDVAQINAHTIELRALIHCQNPTLNPAQLSLAVAVCLPDLKPDHSNYIRHEIYDDQKNVFR